MLEKLIKAAKGEVKADVVLKNASYIERWLFRAGRRLSSLCRAELLGTRTLRGEFMNYPGVINCDRDVIKKLEAAHAEESAACLSSVQRIKRLEL